MVMFAAVDDCLLKYTISSQSKQKQNMAFEDLELLETNHHLVVGSRCPIKSGSAKILFSKSGANLLWLALVEYTYYCLIELQWKI